VEIVRKSKHIVATEAACSVLGCCEQCALSAPMRDVPWEKRS
jgi:hypothetical protein